MLMGLIAVLIAYLTGGIPFGLIVVHFMTGADVRDSGSGNIGATNVLRTSGRLAGVITLLLDTGKGFFSVWLAAMLTNGSDLWTSAAALAVMLGHVFPVYLGFKGGKAVATCVGAFLYLAPVPLLGVAVLFVLLVWSTRYLSLGSIVAAGLLPVACFLILHPEWPMLAASLGSAVLIIWRHKGNIARIRSGTENVFAFRRTVS
jgi:glycerol-3-phosphate acyltransferase PlsY